MKRMAILNSAAFVLLVAACAQSHEGPGAIKAPPQSGVIIPARTCLADGGSDRAMCVTMLGAERTNLADTRTACSPLPLDDLGDTYAVMDWIRAHPDAQDQELADVARSVLTKLYPCS
jgi:hypothetical protein